MIKDLPAPEMLRKLLRYEPETGKLFWLERTPDMFADGKKHSAAQKCAMWNIRFSGKEAFTSVNSHGYRGGHIFGGRVTAHRVAYTIYHDAWPADQIDHINGERADNRIANLRAVTNRDNAINRRRRADNTSGVMGVMWCKQYKKWRVCIKGSKRLKYIGRFADKADAIAARRAAEIEFGYHANHGRVRS